MSLADNYYNFDSVRLRSDCLTELEWSTSEVYMQTKLFNFKWQAAYHYAK